MHHVGVADTRLQQHAGEIGRLRIVALERHHLAAGGGEHVAVDLGAADAGVVVDVQHRRALLAELSVGVFRQRGDIDLGEREHRVDVVAEIGDVGRVGAHVEFERLGPVADRRPRLHDRAPRGDDERHLVDLDQLVGRVDRDLRLGLGIEHQHLERMAVNAAFVVDVLDRHLVGLDEIEAVPGFRPGGRHQRAEAERLLLLRLRASRRNGECRERQRQRRAAADGCGH